MICVPSQMNPSNVQRFATSGIEAVSATIQLPNTHSMQIAVVYRSPCVSQGTSVTVLTRLLRHVSMCRTPCVILSDFNEDIFHHQQSATMSVMSRFNFRQLVTTPTTAQGTLIDRVYYGDPFDQSTQACVVYVKDTYYSDHDTIYCKI